MMPDPPEGEKNTEKNMIDKGIQKQETGSHFSDFYTPSKGSWQMYAKFSSLYSRWDIIEQDFTLQIFPC